MKNIEMQEQTSADRLLEWWYRIAAPAEVPDEAPLRERMRVRSGRLTSVIFLFQAVFLTSSLITTIIGAPLAAPAVGITLVATIVGIFLNRVGKTTAAGILFIIVMIVGLIAAILFTPGGLSPSSLPILDIFLISTLAAASFLSPLSTLLVTLGNCLIIALLITFAPKTPEMLLLLHTQYYGTYADPMELQIIVAATVFLWVNSTYREMKRANSAEEVNKLTLAMTNQQQAVQEEKQQLEESIQQIIAVHMQVANGNLSARVPLDQQNVLWSVAGSLNNLLARLQSWRQGAMTLQQNEQLLQQLIYNIQLAKRQGQTLQAYKTGTSLDALIMEISKPPVNGTSTSIHSNVER